MENQQPCKPELSGRTRNKMTSKRSTRKRCEKASSCAVVRPGPLADQARTSLECQPQSGDTLHQPHPHATRRYVREIYTAGRRNTPRTHHCSHTDNDPTRRGRKPGASTLHERRRRRGGSSRGRPSRPRREREGGGWVRFMRVHREVTADWTVKPNHDAIMGEECSIILTFLSWQGRAYS